MRRAIIHIGMPRTGSTTFQHILARLRPGLAEAGILYPDLTPRSSAHEPHINHQHFGETLDGRRPRRERAELLRALDALLAGWGGDVVLLSYEDFVQQQRRFAIPALLREAFAKRGFVVEALVVVKPQSEHLNSIYAHRAQLMREREDFTAFAARYERSRRFAYDWLVRPWITACEGRVHAVPVRDRRDGAPLVQRMLASLGIEARVAPLLGEDDLGRVENRSPGPVAVEVSRRLRALGLPGRLRVRPREVMRVVERVARDRGFDQESFRGVDMALRDRLAARYRAENDCFARAVWGRDWADIAAAEPAREVNELARRGIDAATERAIREIREEALRGFEVAPPRPWRDRSFGLLRDVSETAQSRLQLSRWRVM